MEGRLSSKPAASSPVRHVDALGTGRIQRFSREMEVRVQRAPASARVRQFEACSCDHFASCMAAKSSSNTMPARRASSRTHRVSSPAPTTTS